MAENKKNNTDVLYPQGENEENEVKEGEKTLSRTIRDKLADYGNQVKGALMTPKKKKMKEIRNNLIAKKNMIIETYNNYPQETKDRIKQELKDLYENCEKGRLSDVDVGDGNAPNFYRWIRFKEEISNKDYSDFFGALFDGIDPYQSTFEEVKIKSSLINGVIKEIIGEKEMERIHDRVWDSYRVE